MHKSVSKLNNSKELTRKRIFLGEFEKIMHNFDKGGSGPIYVTSLIIYHTGRGTHISFLILVKN